MKFHHSLVALACVALMPLTSIAQTKTSTAEPAKTEATQAAPTKSTTPAAATRTKTSRPTKGIVVSLLTLQPVKSEAASAMTNKSALALRVGSRIVYVVKADGSSAGDDLARLADAPVGVVGKTISRSGVTVILADIIDTMK